MSAAVAERTSGVREALLRGRQQLHGRFDRATPLALRAGEPFKTASAAHDFIYRLRTGWACQYSEQRGTRRAIIDVYLPGDLIGMDTHFRTRPIEHVQALTSVEAEAVDADEMLGDLLASHCGALYLAWLLGWRQRRADRLLTAISCLDARGRLGAMMLDFYKRLRARKLIADRQYNMPLTQQHIGEYLGLTVVHVNRVLRSLRADRIVSLERSCVTILDLERLTRLARHQEPPKTPEDQGESDLVSSAGRVSYRAAMLAAAICPWPLGRVVGYATQICESVAF